MRAKGIIIVILLCALALSGFACCGGGEAPAQGKIAFSSIRGGNDEIYVMDPDGSNQTNLTNNQASDASPCVCMIPPSTETTR